MSSYLEESRDLARRWDAARPRTRQKAIGWSGMADCRAYLGYLLRGDWPTDDPDKWRAIAGTMLHEEWTKIRRADLARRGIPASFNVHVSYGKIRGHADEVLWPSEPGGRWEVTDWKFPTLGSIRLWNDDDFLNEMFVQPHGYAAGVMDGLIDDPGGVPAGLNASWLDEDACVVRLLGMPVDAKSMDDWMCSERPFERDIPDDALARLYSVREVLADPDGGEWPPPYLRDKPAFFCKTWCEFWTACRGGEEPKELELITDPELAAAVDQYGLAGELISANEKIRKELRPLIEDARGRTAGGFKVYRTRGGPAKLELDEVAVEAALGSRGVPLTDVQRWGPPGQSKLTVTRA